MSGNHLGTVALALAAITLASPWSHVAMAQIKLASVTAESEGGDVTPESVTRLAIGVSDRILMSECWGLHVGAGYSQKRFAFNSRQNRAKAPGGSQNQSESTVAFPSDCPTK